MIAITTRFIGPTNYRPSRIVAEDPNGHRTIMSKSYTLSDDDAHLAVVREHIKQYFPDIHPETKLISGYSKHGRVYVLYRSEITSVFDATTEITVVFEGIDDWNRPVFREKTSDRRFGSLDKLFPYGTNEEEVLKTVSGPDLLYFGRSFDAEPMGSVPTKPIVIALA